MKKPNQRIGADIVQSDLVELHKSTSNKSATYALHFDTQETNQFCDFTENIQNLISKWIEPDQYEIENVYIQNL